ncbi:MAG: Omp28-related outer membrane protein, partial [Bacteroidota bacterium]
LEDYTGHKCQGCPAAHDEATTIQNTVGHRLVIMALHVGFWATTNSSGSLFTYDFENQTGLDLYGALIPSSQAFPTGTINRKMYGTNRAVIYAEWGNKVNQILQESADASMKVTTSFNSATRVISAHVKTTFLDNLTGDVSLAVYYTEDSIINWQAFPSPTGNQPDYVHRRVLRGALTSTWGTVIATNPVYGFSISGTVTGTPIAADINTEHVHVIAVLSDNVTKEVIQAEEVQLNP